MKRAREDDKALEPLFPRLHVNDTDTGGPKAPPRNKMALYEQFSISRPRFNPASPMLPLPPSNMSNLGPSNNSLSQGCASDAYMPFNRPSYAYGRASSPSSNEARHSTTRTEFESKSANHASSRASISTSSVAHHSTLSENDPIAEGLCTHKLDKVEDFVVPTIDQSGSLAAFSSSTGLPTSSSTSLKTSGTKSRKFDRKHSRRKPKKTSAIENLEEASACHRIESSGPAVVSTDIDGMGNMQSSMKLFCADDALLPDSCCMNNLSPAENSDDVRSSECCNILTVRNELCSIESAGASNLSSNCHQEEDRKKRGSADAERKEEASETSHVDSTVGLEISPADVVGVMGQKLFMIAKGAIEKQQRVFAIQVFELHRLIKVQKLVASSPHLLLGCNRLTSESKEAPDKMQKPEGSIGSQLKVIREQNVSKEPKTSAGPATEKIAGNPSPCTCEDKVNSLRGQEPNLQSRLASSPPTLTVSDRSSPWCLHNPANNWLLPVMSPSEGLVYKPYAGSWPWPGHFVAPAYGGCAPLGVLPGLVDAVNPAHGYSASHLPPNMGFFSHHPAIAPGFLSMNCGLQSMKGATASVVDHHTGNKMNHSLRSSHSMSHSRGEAGHPAKLQEPKDIELQGSKARNPMEKARAVGKDVVSLIAQTAADGQSTRLQPDGRNSETHVIKVVPRKDRSAIESAAKIFRSIQEERQRQEL